MILITGGLGFIGKNVAQALLAMGGSCILTRYQSDEVPDFLQKHIGSRVFIEKVDVTKIDELLALGEKHKVTGIIHLAGGFASGELAPFEEIRSSMVSLANILQVGYQWKVKRVSVASALGVYAGVEGTTWREDQLLSLASSMPIEAFKKAGEVFTSYITNRVGIDCISMRFAAMYGPFYDTSRGSMPGRVVDAAVHGKVLNLEGIRGSTYADDGYDMLYEGWSSRYCSPTNSRQT